LVGSIGFTRHGGNIHSLLLKGVRRELTQFISSDFSDIFRFDAPSTEGHHGCGHLASSLFRKLKDSHFRIQSGEFRNDTEEIHRVETHSNHFKGFAFWKREIESHAFLLQTFELFFKSSK
jgi:hypothetical protein